ncbi:MAG: hypothetical protein M5U19_17850 [Microthrixaceae bacterium]|nr:hypothetical protein [Microthrixaceae bacterium]
MVELFGRSEMRRRGQPGTAVGGIEVEHHPGRGQFGVRRSVGMAEAVEDLEATMCIHAQELPVAT